MIREGTNVKWKWGNGYGMGKVQRTYKEKVSKIIKESKVTREGSDEDKALYIKQQDGDYVLKLESEVERVD